MATVSTTDTSVLAAAAAGRTFDVHTDGADIVGFDPAKDKLNLGSYSVHNFIVVDTPTGVGFMNPWSGEVCVIQGVSLGQLTVDSFTPIENDHLRQDLSGALAYEQGITAQAHTVYARSHELGQVDRVAFDPGQDVVDFRYYGTREQIYMTDSSEGVIISNSGTGQALILLGVKVSDLSVENFVFHAAQVREDRVHLQLGFSTVPASQVLPQGVPVAGTDEWPSEAGTGEPPSGESGTTFAIKWLYGTATVLDFNPAVDRLDFGWFKAAEFSVTEVNGSVVIAIEGNKQTYTLEGVALHELAINNIIALDTGARTEWQGLIDTATPPASLPVLSVEDARIAEGDAGTTMLVFTVRLSAAADGPVSVSYSTLNGTATAGSDYDSAVGTLTFAAGETEKSVHVTVRSDTLVEVDEALSLHLSSPSGATIMDGSAVGTIVNDDVDTAPGTLPRVSIADLSVGEGNGDHMHFMFMVTLDKASAETVSVKYKTADGTALAGSDYTKASGTVTFAPGETSKMVHVDILGDTVVEANETFKVKLSTPVGATIGDGTAVGTILNDDLAAPLPTLTVADARFKEGGSDTAGTGRFVVTLSQASDTPVTVKFATSDGSALAGADYVGKTGTLTFAAGETEKVVKVKAIGDGVAESDEHFGLTLSQAKGATIADGVASGTIVNDDAAPVLPTLSIADARFKEGSADASGKGKFVVTLSEASDTPVTVKFATSDGTALAGADYVGKIGTITFAAGETEKVIKVAAIGDGAKEANETFSVTLKAASGATIKDGQATGTIVNDDKSAVPTVSISNAQAVEGDPGTGAAASGWFSTSGNQIVDAAGNSVQIAGVNWFGFESSNLAPHGLWTRSYTSMIDQMKDLGFNTIRLPFSSEMLHSSATPNGIDFSKNPDLKGLSAIQIMDKIIEYAGEAGMKVILDHHRSDSGAGTSSNGLWYDSTHSEAAWVDDWQMLAARYADDPTVIGADLHNEPYAGTWGGGGTKDWAAAAEKAGDAIGTVNPNWLIFVEGIATYDGENYWWGGNLMGVRDRPIELEVDNKLVYSAHDYPNSVYAQPWFQAADFPANLTEKFDEMWGYIYKEGIAPVYIGEFGTSLTDPKDAPWLDAITAYLAGDFDNDGVSDIPAGDTGMSWTFWSWNPNSGDTGGILNSDWTTVNTAKLAYLEPIQFDFATDVEGGGDGGEVVAYARFEVSLSQAAAEIVTLGYHTMAGDASDTDFTAQSGTVTFAAGETTKIISIAITPDQLTEANETFSVMLTDAKGAVIGGGVGTGTILDDDPAAPVDPEPDPDPAPADTDLDALLKVVDSWASGFNASIVIHNDGSATSAWQLEIDMPYEITNIWNAEILSRTDDGYVIGNADWNGAIGAGGEVSFGFIGQGHINASDVDIII